MSFYSKQMSLCVFLSDYAYQGDYKTKERKGGGERVCMGKKEKTEYHL
jgi:hypothetical protein